MAISLEDTTYVLPIRRTAPVQDDLPAYLAQLTSTLAVVVVDGSPADVFARHAALWPPAVLHLPVDQDRRADLNGKVAGVVTGLRRVTTAKAVIADDDVRYDAFTLHRLAGLLDDAAIVLPQNVYRPAPLHALLDTGRCLIARATGGDWPGTLGLRMDVYRRAGAYDGDVLFENLELVRTMEAAGGRVRRANDLFVLRRPPSPGHYAGQRIRQAYDEFARPARLAVQLALAPALIAGTARFGARAPLAFGLAAMALAETGRRTAGGRRAFSPLGSLLAPLWAVERAATAWLAVGVRLTRGGVRYSHGTLRVAANPARRLRSRLAERAA